MHLLPFKLVKVTDVFVQHFFVQRIFKVTPLFLRDNQVGIGKLLYMMRDGWLGQGDEIMYLGTVQAVILLLDLLQNANPIGVAQRFRYALKFF